jgi:hypothetical protein
LLGERRYMSEFVFILLITIIVFLIFREIFCWYWKVNSIVGILERIDRRLESLESSAEEQNDYLPPSSDAMATPPAPSMPPAAPETIACPECAKSIEMSKLNFGNNGLTKCPYCSGYFTVEGV